MKNKAIQQVQEYARITLSVAFTGPHFTGNQDDYEASFFLLLKVDTGSGVGEGKSQEVKVIVRGSNPMMAHYAAEAVREYAERKVQAMELTEAMVAFPVIIADLVVKE